MMGEEERLPTQRDGAEEIHSKPENGARTCVCGPIYWFRMLAKELHWSFVFGVVIVYGMSQGLGGALAMVGTEYYMKDVQKVQPSDAQFYSGITSIPWIVKPIWGLLTDVVPVFGFHRKPYFLFAGFMGVFAMLFVSIHKELHIVLALLSLTAGSASVAIADVTVDACVAQKSGIHPSLAADIQSLCALSAAIGSLVGFSFSGIFVHLIGPQGVFGLLTIPAWLVLLVGLLLKENRISNFPYEQMNQNFLKAGKSMWKTLKCPEVWRPCLYMYLSFSLSLSISEGMFYWATDSKDGPSFSKEIIGYVMAIGSIGSLLGAILYQYGLKNCPFRDLLMWAQILSCLSGMLDLALVLRWNLKLGIPDYFFVVIDASVSQLIGRLKWMPLLVMSSKLCPAGIEGTFFALLMSIDNFGLLTSSWFGGLLLRVLKVTRTEFGNLWVAVLVRNLLRISPLFLLFLVPKGDPNSAILSDEVLNLKVIDEENRENENVELVSLVRSLDSDGR